MLARPAGENFAEKWNDDPKKKVAFDNWHAHVLATLDEILRPKQRGLQTFAAANSKLVGEDLVNRAMEKHGKKVLSLQEAGKLAVTTGTTGLILGTSTKAPAMTVRGNTYFGA